jgi:hypothetical protein
VFFFPRDSVSQCDVNPAAEIKVFEVRTRLVILELFRVISEINSFVTVQIYVGRLLLLLLLLLLLCLKLGLFGIY